MKIIRQPWEAPQRREQEPSIVPYALSTLLPPVGLVWGIVWLAVGDVGPGLALWGCALLGLLLWPVVLIAL